MAWRHIWRLIARHRELALALTFIGAAGWELIEYMAIEGPHGAGGPLPITLHSAQVLIGLGVTWAVIRAWQERSRYEDALAQMVEKVVMAQEEERRRIAYDLHDGIAQLIVSAKQHVDTCRDLAARDPARADRELSRAAERLQGAIVETRRVLKALRPSALDAVGLAKAMRRALDEAAQEAGWDTRFVDDMGDDRVPAAVETAAFRILQESLVNASRHAASTTVEVSLARRQGWLHLEVKDDGVGFGQSNELAAGRGLGLAGMRERARLLGGTFAVESATGRGTRISVALPLEPRLS